MIRALLMLLLAVVAYQAVKVIARAAFRGYHQDKQERRLPGTEMVQDPQCRTYIVKDRAVVRRIGGEQVHFCSTTCADRYEQGRQD